ncbi:MAG: MoxR family ATPase [Chloroflexi bacterium]|nr:MoxR family ATPase [Ardenticatenaceae bacterium]MBL1128632.1 MoxR family ATPase [Chloroflexota bacterium]NOG34710.1 MoxR family ATPase [Chloroflexota bacterium]GIK55079.1 MAG: ATPase [Chloroflexota bacterium]
MIAEIATRLRQNIQKVIVGKDEVIDLALIAMLTNGHLLLEDVPGTGKTTLAKTIAASLGCTFHRVQFTPDLLPSDVTGIYFYNQKEQLFEFRPGPIFAQILLADEINRATPRTQSALLEAMQERQVTVDIATHALPRPFLVLATQNPIELEGTFPLPEAQLDRFLMKIAIGYPSAREENDLLLRFEQQDPLDSLEKVVEPEEVMAMQTEVRAVRVEESVRQYVVNICRTTRSHEDIDLGASPRATMALYHTSKARAAIHGRDFVIPDDVKQLAPYVLTHRLVVNPQTRLRGRQPADIIHDVVNTVAVPVENR